MKNGTTELQTTTAGLRWRKFVHPTGAVAAVGVVTLLAVTPLLARSLMQFSAGLIETPDYLHASASGFEEARRFEPRGTASRPFAASGAPVIAEEVTVLQPAPRFDDFDPQRLSAQVSATDPLPAVEHYGWLAGAAGEGAQLRPALAMANLDQRFAAMRWPGAVSEPVTIAEAWLDGQDEGTMSDDSAPVQLAMAAPLPETRPEARGLLATVIPEAIAVPIPRPARAAVAKPQETRTALAYANPDAGAEAEPSEGVFGRLFGGNRSRLPGPGSKVAVYEIETATVYMPNGEKLEAHSGLAHMKDDSRYVTEKNKGPTPPNLYDLRMRESLFHGVEAIRLLPADGKKKYNRDGLLAHTYMYIGGGGNDLSQSNGCVVFKDYDRFLKAFKRGEIEHLIVVPTLKEVPTYMAAL